MKEERKAQELIQRALKELQMMKVRLRLFWNEVRGERKVKIRTFWWIWGRRDTRIRLS